jgi:tricorn protease
MVRPSCSDRRATAFDLTGSKLYTVPMNGAPRPPSPCRSPVPDNIHRMASKSCTHPCGAIFAGEKRYQGGWANDLYIFDLLHPALLQVTNDPHTDRDPMWIGDAVYFNSDRSGVFNLYRYDVATRQTRQLTHYKDWDVRWPSADAEGQIVYELDGELHIYDVRKDEDRALSILVPADATTSRPQSANAADNIESLTLSPGGERVGIVARGDVFSVPVEHGATRNLTRSSSAHEREAAWSTDGKRLAYVSDRSGEEELYTQTQDGSDPALQLTSGSMVRYYAPRWSGDNERIAIADNTGRLSVIEVAAKKRTLIARDPAEMALDYRWSPDGRYLSYSLNDLSGFSSVFIWSVADGKSRRVTPQYFNAQSAAWAPGGDLLYFLSAREYQPSISSIEFDFATDRQTGIFALTLRKDAKNPFGIRDDEPGDNKPSDDKSGDDKEKSKARSKGSSKAPVKIDFDGIEQRAIRVPLEADNLSNLAVGDDSLLYQRNGPFYYGRDSSLKATVMAYSIKDRETKPVAEDVTSWSTTADGKHVLAQPPPRK